MSKTRVLLLLTVIALLSVAVGIGSAPPTSESAAVAAPPAAYGIAQRTPWSCSHIAGAPGIPDPFTTSDVFPALKFDRPLHLEISPNGNRWFVCQQMGLIYSIPTSGDVRTPDPFLDIRTTDRQDPKWTERRTVWSMTFHPKFAENGFVYVCYLENKPLPQRCRISRYVVSPEARAAKVPTCDPATESVICEWEAHEDHFGGCLKFGPDGLLYFSVGDGGAYADGHQSGQDLSDLNASLLRIDVDHPENGRAYGIPKDNPFVNLAGARPEIFAYGVRNIWKFSIDQATGNIWGGDVGQDLWESVLLIQKGGNYGWSVSEGTHSFRPERKVGPTPILKPIWEYEHSVGRSVTGGFVYHGKAFPELANKYVYGDYETGKVWALTYDGSKPAENVELVDTPFKLVAFGQDAAGELMLLDYQGTLHKLEHAPKPVEGHEARNFPTKLSQTGLFSSTVDLTPAPGVIPYGVNSPLWSDGAAKQRYLAVPNDGKIVYNPEGAWGFPDGSVMVKTFSLDMEQGNPATRKRLETRILHIEQKEWRGYTYIWNEAQTDADLLEDEHGLNKTYDIKDAASAGGIRKQTWHFPSRAECTLCHTMPCGYLLGLNTLQMNRNYDYAGGKDNQIRALEHAGLFDKPVLATHRLPQTADATAADYELLPSMPDPQDPHATLDERARSYLHANCSHCHRRMGGGNALFEMTYGLPLDDTKMVEVKPQHGEHGLGDARLLCLGDPARSLILHRMKQLDDTRMPRVASGVLDAAGIKLIEQWVDWLK